VRVDDVASMLGDVVIEAPAGADAAGVARALNARVLVVARDGQKRLDVPDELLAGIVITHATVGGRQRENADGHVIAALPEDRVLAAPSVADIAAALGARWVAGEDAAGSIERVMIGTVSSVAATPYFAQRERTCVITRFDKTDIQLAALQTDLACLVLTGGGEPSPYLIDRVRGYGEDIAVLLTSLGTPDATRAIEGLYGLSRFDGAGKMRRAAELLDAAGAPVQLLADAGAVA
jgi:BioD-like phosphotransacetylase family protein